MPGPLPPARVRPGWEHALLNGAPPIPEDAFCRAPPFAPTACRVHEARLCGCASLVLPWLLGFHPLGRGETSQGPQPRGAKRNGGHCQSEHCTSTLVPPTDNHLNPAPPHPYPKRSPRPASTPPILHLRSVTAGEEEEGARGTGTGTCTGTVQTRRTSGARAGGAGVHRTKTLALSSGAQQTAVTYKYSHACQLVEGLYTPLEFVQLR